jgi:fructose-bisphosphate aldolase class II
MPLVNLNEIMERAEREKYAVGAFNCNNMEIVQAIVEAAVEENSPVIIQASQGAIKYAGLDYIIALVRTAADNNDIPICLHLDHGTDFNQVKDCIDRGFSSVMYDGSQHSLEENIRITKEVLEIARTKNVSVEGELGKIGGTEDDVHVDEADANYTDPEEAKRYVDETGIDALAVAIGTAHGQYKGEPKLRFDILEEIKKRVNIPIVLHGSSGVPDEAIRRAVELGVRKINIDTNIREAFVKGVHKAIEDNPQEIDPRKILGPAKAEMKEIVREKIRLFGSAGKGGQA